MIEVKRIVEITPEIVEAFSRLIPQLDTKAKIPQIDDLQCIVNDNSKYLFLAYNPNIVGTITLAIVKTPSGAKAWIEDVVVDQDSRGQHIGEKMLFHAIDFAKKIDISSINLTSSPNRETANKLYQKIGFKLRDTNVYRIACD